MSAGIFFKFLLTSEVISKQRVAHENEIMQDLQNYKCQDNGGHFRKPEQASVDAMKNNYPKTVHTFFSSCSILATFYV